jgi:DNA-directed RNA polymerase specialized sigma24 family protein
MDLEDAKQRQALQNDERDLFAAVVALGEESQEYDLEQDTYVTAFKRSEQWKEALNAIRKWVLCTVPRLAPIEGTRRLECI